jgi:hypothetical protein
VISHVALRSRNLLPSRRRYSLHCGNAGVFPVEKDGDKQGSERCNYNRNRSASPPNDRRRPSASTLSPATFTPRQGVTLRRSDKPRMTNEHDKHLPQPLLLRDRKSVIELRILLLAGPRRRHGHPHQSRPPEWASRCAGLVPMAGILSGVIIQWQVI